MRSPKEVISEGVVSMISSRRTGVSSVTRVSVSTIKEGDTIEIIEGADFLGVGIHRAALRLCRFPLPLPDLSIGNQEAEVLPLTYRLRSKGVNFPGAKSISLYVRRND